jgi:Cd2+/Zn2+-exporting ATPase
LTPAVPQAVQVLLRPGNATASVSGQARLFKIATMDCSAEEAEIRRALEPLEGIRSLGFQLGARTLKIDAQESAYPLALEAIRKAGFDPQPVAAAARSEEGQAAGHAEGDDHQHGFAGGISAWLPRLYSPRERRCSPSSHPIKWPGR